MDEQIERMRSEAEICEGHGNLSGDTAAVLLELLARIDALNAERDEWINDVHPTSLRGVWHDLRTRHARIERENAALLKVADALREQHVRDRIALNRLCDYFDSSAETADDRWQMKRLLDAWKAGDQVSGQP
jgi:hypothetical protein